MKFTYLGGAVLFITLCVLKTVDAQPRPGLLAPVVAQGDAQPKQPDKDKDKDKKQPEKKDTDPPATDIFTRTPAPIRDALGYNPQMMGDLKGYFANRSVTVLGLQTTTTTILTRTPQPFTQTVTTTTPVAQQRTFLVPVPNYGAFKVGENASPIPTDRVYFSYNYWNAIRHPSSANSSHTTQTTTQNIGAVQVTTTVNTFLPGAPAVDLHRETFGFEKTFLDGRASLDFRLPVYQQINGLDGFRANHMGDLTIVGKYALFFDQDVGDVFSIGLAVTAPTGPGIDTTEGRIHSTFLQPWFGYMWNRNRTYVQGFHSVVMPTDPRDVTVLFNDVALGFWLYEGAGDRPLRFIVPTVEAHVTTPLSNRDIASPIFVPDEVALTGGVHVGLGRRSIFSFGAVVPVTGPRTYSIEAFGQLNLRF